MATWTEIKKKRLEDSAASGGNTGGASASKSWKEIKAERLGTTVGESDDNGTFHFDDKNITRLDTKKSNEVNIRPSAITVDTNKVVQAKADRYKTPDVSNSPDFAKYVQTGAKDYEDGKIKIGNFEIKSGADKIDNFKDVISQGERNVYNYWLGKGDDENAKKFLKSITPELNKRRSEKDSGLVKQVTNKSKVAGVALDLATNLTAPAGLIETGRAKLMGEDVDTNSPAFMAARTARDVEDELFKNSSGLGKFFGQTGLSMAKYATMLPFGQVGALTIMSSGAGGNAAFDATNRGASTGEALTIGLTTGITEYLTEKLPMDNLFRLAKSGVSLITKQGVKQVLKQAGIEGTEEVVSQYVNTLTDMAVMGNRSSYAIMKAELIASGMSEEEASKQAKLEMFVKQPAIAFAGGALSGGVFGSGAVGISTYNVSKTGSTMRGLGIEQDIIDTGLESEESSNSFEKATKVSDVMKNGGKASNYDIGNLYYENVNAINAENDKAQQNGIETMLTEDGVDQAEAAKLSGVMMKALSGDPISNAEAEVIIKNESARRLFTTTTGYDVPLSTMSQMRKSIKKFSEDVVSGKTNPVYIAPQENAPILEPQATSETVVPPMQENSQKTNVESQEATQKVFTKEEIKGKVSKFGRSGALSFGKNYKGREDFENYSKAFEAYYLAGRHGMTIEQIDKSYSQFSEVLSPAVKFSAHVSGQNDAKAEANAPKKATTPEKIGLNDSKGIEKNVASIIDILGKITSTDIEIVDSISVNGKAGMANGSYKNGKVQIALDADDALLDVAKHEITHRMKETSPKEYKAYTDFIAQIMTENGTLESNIDKIDKLYQKNGQKLTFDAIMDEIAANFTGEIMNDEKLFNELAIKEPSNAQKLLDFLKEFIAKIQSAISKSSPDVRNSLGFNLEELQKVEALWVAGLKAAVVVDNNNDNVNPEGDTKMSLKDRLNGDALLDAEDLIDAIKTHEGNVDDNGYITVYHATNNSSAENIIKSGKMSAKEDGLFFSTKPDGQITGYGDTVIEMKIPVEKFEIDDMFENEVHLRIKLKNLNQVIDVSQYLVKDVKFSLKDDEGYQYTNDNLRSGITKVRGGWTIDKITKELKGATNRSDSSKGRFNRAISQFESPEEFADHLFFHGTGGYIPKGLRPGAALPKSAFRSGGYDEMYHTISLSKSKNTAANFTGDARSGSVYPVILKRGANVIERPDIQDSVELEDELVELWEQGIDAVKIGNWDSKFSEQEIAVLNPKALVLGEPQHYQVFQQKRFENPTMDEIKEMYEESLKYDYNSLGRTTPKYSLKKDSEGKDLTEEQAEFFKDSQVRNEAGNLIKMYHGTSEDFTIFSKEKSNGGIITNAFYFTPDKRIASEYSSVDGDTNSKVISAYLNIENPMEYGKTYSTDLLKKFPKEMLDKYSDDVRELERDFTSENFVRFANFVEHTSDNKMVDMFKIIGFDGYVNRDSNVYVAFEPNQIKDVTNLNPTFDDDINFSLKEVSSMDKAKTGREITLKVFKGKGAAKEKVYSKYQVPVAGDANYYAFDKEMAAIYGDDITEETITFKRPLVISSDGDWFNLVKKAKLAVRNPAYLDSEEKVREWASGLKKYVMAKRHDGIILNFNNGEFYPENKVLNRVFAHNQAISYKADDAKYSLKGESQILKDNAALKEMNDMLRAELKLTDKVTVDKKKVDAYAKTVLKEHSSYFERSKLTDGIEALYNDMSAEQVDFDLIMEKARAISYEVLGNSSVINNNLYNEYKGLIKGIREAALVVNDIDKKEIDHAAGNYNEFRKRNMGILNLVTPEHGGMSIDTYYQELVELYPEFFDEDIANQGEQIIRIRDVVRSLQPITENPYSEYMDDAVDYLSYEMLDEFFNIPQNKPTFADKQNKNLIHEKIKAANQRRDLREKQKARIEVLKERGREKIKDSLATEKARRIEQVVKLKEHYKAKEKSKTKSVADRQMRIRIERIVKELSQKLLSPTDKQHVPDALKVPVAEFLKSIDFSTNRQMQGTRNKLYKLQLAYSKIAAGIDQGDADFYLDIDPDFINLISDLAETIGDKRVVDMTSDELMKLDQVARIIKATISNYNKLLSDGLREDVFFKGESVIDELRGNKVKGDSGYELIKSLDKLVNLDMLAPADYFELLGDSMTDMYGNLRKGLDKKIENTKTITDHMSGLLKGQDIKTWTGNKATVTTFDLGGKKKVDLTPAQVMSLYLLDKRDQAKGHIYEGGIKHAPIVTKKKGILSITKSFEPVRVTEADVKRILATLTPEQMKVADGISEFLNTYTSDWGNEVSMAMYGYKKFTEKNYFPIKSDDNYLVSEFGVYTDPSLKGKGFTKATVKGAKNPIIVDDIFDVFTKIADESSSYNAFVLPLSDMQKVVNYRGISGSVKQSIEKKLGSNAIKYFSKLMIDINGGIRTDVEIALVSKLLTNYKAALMGLNPRVIIQQPTALIRATAMIDPAYIAKGIAKKGDWNKVIKYSQIAQWKSWGFFSMDTGRQMKDILMGADSTFRDWSFKPIQAADNAAWSKLWNAVEFEVMDRQPELTEGTPLFYEAVGRRFNEIIDRTQVVDTVLHRTQIMRSSSTMMKVYTSFMGEPLKSYNLLRSSIAKAVKTGSEEDRKKAARTMGAWVATVLVNSLVVSLMDFWRRAEDDDKFFETYLKFVGANSLNDLTGMIPFIRDIASMLNGYAPKRMELDGINDARKAGVKLGKYVSAKVTGQEPESSALYIVKDTAASLSKLIGWPISNVNREIESIMKNYVRRFDSNELDYAVTKMFHNIGSSENRSKYTDILFKTLVENDKEAAKAMYTDMIGSGIEKSYIDSGLKRRFGKALDGTSEIEVIVKSINDWRDSSESERTDARKKELIAEFNTSANALMKAGYSKEEINKSIKRTANPEEVMSMKKLLKAYDEAEGDTAKQAEFAAMANRMVDSGVDGDDIRDAIEAHKEN